MSGTGVVSSHGGCTLCPRRCGSNREISPGFCGGDDQLRIARAALHFWEEPALTGQSGKAAGTAAGSADTSDGRADTSDGRADTSVGRADGAVGAIFFVGCPLHCVYCQNREISSGENRGRAVSARRFREICFALREDGGQALDLVTPMHYAPQLREALLPIKKSLGIPVICNTGGYDSHEQIEEMRGIADIYLPDYKYSDPMLAEKYSNAPDYPAVAENAIGEMLSQVGKPVFEGSKLLRGVLVRHLVLPSHRKESIAALRRLRSLFSPDELLLSLMSQYTPPPGMEKPLQRRVTSFEYESVLEEAVRLGFHGYCQRRSSAKEEYTPPFDLTGVSDDRGFAP